MNYIWENDPFEGEGHLPPNSEYILWYKKHTRRWISRTCAKDGHMVDILERMYFTVTTEGQSSFSFENIRSELRHCLQIFREVDRITTTVVSAPAPSQVAQESDDIPAGRVEGQGLPRRRRRVEHEQLTMPPPPQLEPDMYYVPPAHPFDPVSSYYYPSQPTPPNVPSPHFDYPPPFTMDDCYMTTPPFNVTPPMYTQTTAKPTTPTG